MNHIVCVYKGSSVVNVVVSSVNPPTSSLTDRSLTAVKWNYLGVLVRIASQLIAQIALARLLGPEAFGLFAAAILFVGVGGIVVELGLGSALVQKRDLAATDIRFAFTWVLTAGMVMAIVVFLSADYVASFFEDPRVADILRGLTPAFVLQALSVVPLSLLRRDLAFKAVQGVQIVSYIGGFLVIGIGSALLGAGVWSLVMAWIGQTGLSALILFAIRRHPAKPLFYGGTMLFSGFGSRVLLTNFANWAIENVDNLMVGRFFGPTSLGHYAVSYNLVRNPTNHLVATLQTVLFPTSARAQDNLEGLRRAYLTVLAGVALIAFPLLAGVAAVSQTVVEAMFGSRWDAAAPVLLPLAVAMMFHAVMAISGPVMWGRGAVGNELKVQIVIALALVAAMFIASRYSVVAMAWSVCAVYLLRLIGMTAALSRNIQLQLSDLARAGRGGVMAAMVSVAVLLVVDTLLADNMAVIRLGLDVGLSILAMLIFLLVFPRIALSDELAWILHRLLGRVPWLGQSMLMQRLGSGRKNTFSGGKK